MIVYMQYGVGGGKLLSLNEGLIYRTRFDTGQQYLGYPA